MTNATSITKRLRTGLAAVLATAFVAGTVAPAAAVGVSAADDYGLARLGDDYGSSSFRHHFYRNVPNKGLSYEDHEAFRDAKGEVRAGEAL